MQELSDLTKLNQVASKIRHVCYFKIFSQTLALIDLLILLPLVYISC